MALAHVGSLAFRTMNADPFASVKQGTEGFAGLWTLQCQLLLIFPSFPGTNGNPGRVQGLFKSVKRKLAPAIKCSLCAKNFKT